MKLNTEALNKEVRSILNSLPDFGVNEAGTPFGTPRASLSYSILGGTESLHLILFFEHPLSEADARTIAAVLGITENPSYSVNQGMTDSYLFNGNQPHSLTVKGT